MEQYMLQLKLHIGRVTSKWKLEGVYTAVSNIASWFDYGSNENILRQLFLLRTEQRADPEFVVETPEISTITSKAQNPAEAVKKDPKIQKIPEEEILSKLRELQYRPAFYQATRLTNVTFSLVLRRIGDENVLPHVCVMLSFLSTLASVEYVAHLLDSSPWANISRFLNALIKSQKQPSTGADWNDCIYQTVFPFEEDAQRQDELPLPEDWLIRGLIWAGEYLPTEWFERERDKKDRYLELASTRKNRTERVLRLGHRLATVCTICGFPEIDTDFSAQPLDILRRRQSCFYLHNGTMRRFTSKEELARSSSHRSDLVLRR